MNSRPLALDKSLIEAAENQKYDEELQTVKIDGCH